MYHLYLLRMTLAIVVATLLTAATFAEPGQADEKLATKVAEMIASAPRQSIERENSISITSGKVLSAAISAMGSYRATFDDQGNLAVWDLDNDKQLYSIKPAGEPKTGVVAVVSKGPVVAFGHPSGRVDLYVGSKGEGPLNSYSQLKSPIVEVGLSDSGRFYAFDEHGASIIGKAREENVQEIPPSFDAAAKPRTVMAVAGPKSWWRISILDKEVRNKRYDGKKVTDDGPKYYGITHLSGQDGSWDKSAIYDHSTLNVAYCDEIDEGRGKVKEEAVFAVLGEIIAIKRDLRQVEEWVVTKYALQICSIRRNDVPYRVIKLPDEMKRPLLQIAPMGGRLVSFDAGEAIVWKVVGKPVAKYYNVQYELNKLLEKEDVATLDLIAEKMDGLSETYSDSSGATPCAKMLRHFQAFPDGKATKEDQIKRYERLLKKHPDSKVLRLALYYFHSLPIKGEDDKAITIGYRKAWNYVKPLLSLEKPPAEAYVDAFDAGRVLKFDRNEMGGYLRQAFEHWPKVYQIYAAAALSVSPRFGGRPEAAESIAVRVADAVGGDEGDMIYVEIGRYVAYYNGDIGIATSGLKFDKARMKRGFMLLIDRYDRKIPLHHALHFAGSSGDREMADAIVKRFCDYGVFPEESVYPHKYPVVDQAMVPLIRRLNGE